jgi:hypothetical protein
VGTLKRVIASYGRVNILHPGKHGPKDYRVEFCQAAPSHAEFLAIAYGLLRAEDRYDAPHQQGRWMLKRCLDDIAKCRSWDDALKVIERASQSVQQRRAA